MSELTALPNIGPRIAALLDKVGIHNYSDLKKTGSVNTIIKLRIRECEGCYSMLYALEGAIRKDHISKEDRRALKAKLEKKFKLH